MEAFPPFYASVATLQKSRHFHNFNIT